MVLPLSLVAEMTIASGADKVRMVMSIYDNSVRPTRHLLTAPWASQAILALLPVCSPRQQGYGTRGSGKDATCSLCPAGTYSKGGNMEACVPCPFGFTSPVGATSKEQCQLTPQACPIGQWAPETAVAQDECRCYAGFGGEVWLLQGALRCGKLAEDASDGLMIQQAVGTLS
jgi:hypothetical protein